MSAGPTPESHASLGPTHERLLRHARALVGLTLAELADGLGVGVPIGNAGRHTKGWSGQIIERELGAGDGGERGPDFAALGIELKTVPVARTTRGWEPVESTAVCHIDPIAIAAETWEGSYVRRKLARVLFIALEVPPAAGVGDRRVGLVTLWTPSPAEEAILRGDFEFFVTSFFRPGRAAELTGHHGQALQVRPKGRNAADLRRAHGPAGEAVKIGKTGFYLRPAFVGRILRTAAMLGPG